MKVQPAEAKDKTGFGWVICTEKNNVRKIEERGLSNHEI